ncbi:MAG TPA: GNAT family N-acetyltransferase [Kiritimatiellia bacterium]|nr:GNAT family N-acetyltransferase [Kiritimatiellia bacterium]HMP34829.1 GNAT family N-acetyltransferase [Kiritimatiellia bacterium]
MNQESFQAVVAGAEHRDAWDALVSASPDANSFLRWESLDLIARTDSYGVRFHRVAVIDVEGGFRGAWALPFRTKAGFRYSTYFEFFYAGPFLHPDLESGSVHHARERMEVMQALASAQADFLDVIEAETHPAMTDVRPFLYAGWQVHPLYTHVWDMSDQEQVWNSMNREKRRLIRRTTDTMRFGFEPGDGVIEDFITLYRRLITKFDWVPLPRWDHDLRRRLVALRDRDEGRLYAGRDAAGELKAAVITLLSRDDRTAYLWRCAYTPDPEAHTVVPTLYWQASIALRAEWGAPLHVNFGGSPRLTLTLFKDYLGARPVVHYRLVHERPGLKTGAWRMARRWKESVRRIATRRGLLGTLYRRRATAAAEEVAAS